MKVIPVIALTLTVVTPPVAGAQDLRQSSLREAARIGGRELAGSSAERRAPADWTRVRRLTPAEKIRVKADGGVDRIVRYADVTTDELVVVSIETLPGKARAQFLDLVRERRQVVPPAGTRSTHGSLELTQTDILWEGVRVASLDDVVLRVPRQSVVSVARPWKGSLAGGIGGAAGGLGLGFLTALKLAFKQCGGSCGDEKFLIGLSLVGMPIAGGLAGAKLVPHEPWKVIYER